MIETLVSWLSYQAEKPLIFTQLYFWGFYALVLVGYSIVYPRKSMRNAYLFFISLFFYFKTSGFFVLILIFSTLSDYFIGLKIHKSERQIIRKWWLALSIILNLGVLFYFKYAYFFTDSYNEIFGSSVEVYNHFAHWSNGFFGTTFRADKILLPVGISFFTFQTISYAVDVYRKELTPVKSILDFGFYVAFFPQLVAGPIVRASEFVPQLYKPYVLSKAAFGLAVFWIINGLLKKMFLADYIAVNFIDRVFSNPGSFSGFENMIALFGYSLQVYADFSGYTDIAIGVAALLGFTLPVNFNSPYKATHVGDFWKRWHISLSSWLKDYLYIPMGGNRKGSLFSYIMVAVLVLFVLLLWQSLTGIIIVSSAVLFIILLYRIVPTLRKHIDTNINLMLTMTIGGLWHGASWNMVIWGAINGVGLVFYKYWSKISPWKNKQTWYLKVWGIALTLIFITFTRTWFRGESLESTQLMLEQIAFRFNSGIIFEVIQNYKVVFSFILGGYIIHWIPSSWKQELRDRFSVMPFWVQAFAVFLTIVLIYQVISAELQPFIYFIF
jgi:alginate O-acetyltransferase complex protein AlgI